MKVVTSYIVPLFHRALNSPLPARFSDSKKACIASFTYQISDVLHFLLLVLTVRGLGRNHGKFALLGKPCYLQPSPL